MVVIKLLWILVILSLLATESLSQELNEEEIHDRVKRSHEDNLPYSSRTASDKKTDDNHQKLQITNPINLQPQNVGLIPVARQLQDKVLIPAIKAVTPKINLRLGPTAVSKTKEKPAKNIVVSPTPGNYPVHFYMMDKKTPNNGPTGSTIDKPRPTEANPKPENAKPTKQDTKQADVVKAEILNPVPPSISKAKPPTEVNSTSNLQKLPPEVQLSKINKTAESISERPKLNVTENKVTVNNSANKTKIPLTVQTNVTSKAEDKKSNFIVGLNSTKIDKKEGNDRAITVTDVVNRSGKVNANETIQEIPKYRSSTNDQNDQNNNNLFDLTIGKDQNSRSIIDILNKAKDNVPMNRMDNIEPPWYSVDANEYPYQRSANSDANGNYYVSIPGYPYPNPPYVYRMGYPFDNKITIPDQCHKQPQYIPMDYQPKNFFFQNAPRTNTHKKMEDNLSVLFNENMERDENNRVSRIWRNIKIGTNNRPGCINVNLSCREIRRPYQGYYYYKRPLIGWNGYYTNQNMPMTRPYFYNYYPRYYY